MNRRDFLWSLASVGATAHAGVLQPESLLFQESRKTGYSILQGMTDASTAQFTVVLPKDAAFALEIVDRQNRPYPLTRHDVVARPFSNFVVHKIAVAGLALGRVYLLRVRDEAGKLRDEREFRALDLGERAVKLAFVSCACDHLHRDDVWDRLDRQNADLVFFIGDAVYGDRPGFFTVRLADPEQMWNRYVDTRNRVAFYFQPRLTPVLAVWDDHDFGGNNQNSAYAYKDQTREIFETFYAQTGGADLARGPGIASRLSAFGADFFLMDGRTFRGPWNDETSRMFGDAQETWLFDSVRDRASWLINGSMFYGAYTGKDSFEGQYAADFARFLPKLRRSPGLFCFGSGDVHFSEVMDIGREQLGYATFEMVSSSMHSYTFPGHEWRWRNGRRRVATSAHNFVVFEGTFAQDRIDGALTSFSASGVEFRTEARVTR